MSEGVALNVRPSPGAYRCTWEIPPGFGICNAGEQVVSTPTYFSGNVQLHGDRAPTGAIYNLASVLTNINLDSGETSSSFPQTHPLRVLRGYLEDTAFEIVLLNVSIFTWAPQESEVTAAIALVGVDLPTGEQPRFAGATVQVSGIDAIGGCTPLIKTEYPPPGSDYRSGEWQATGNGDSAQRWFDGAAELTHEFDISSSVFDPYHFRVGFTPVIRIEVTEPLTIREWLDGFVSPLQRITSVATGREESITYLTVQHEKKGDRQPGSRMQVYGTGITQEPFASRESAVKKAKSAFTAAHDRLSLLELVMAWRHQLDEQNPMLETYNPRMLRRDQHPRARYLLLIQALEGLHGHQTRDTFDKRTEEHLKKKTRVVERLNALVDNPDVELDRDDLKFVKSRIGGRPPEGLDQGLKALFKQVKAEKLVEELAVTPLIQRVDAEYDLKGEVNAALVKIRNDLAHGNRGYPAHELVTVVNLLDRIARAHLLRVIGCPEGVQARAMEAD